MFDENFKIENETKSFLFCLKLGNYPWKWGQNEGFSKIFQEAPRFLLCPRVVQKNANCNKRLALCCVQGLYFLPVCATFEVTPKKFWGASQKTSTTDSSKLCSMQCSFVIHTKRVFLRLFLSLLTLDIINRVVSVTFCKAQYVLWLWNIAL